MDDGVFEPPILCLTYEFPRNRWRLDDAGRSLSQKKLYFLRRAEFEPPKIIKKNVLLDVTMIEEPSKKIGIYFRNPNARSQTKRRIRWSPQKRHHDRAAQAWERDKLERLCRYISRPAISEKRLSLTSAGNIRYQLKTPYSDGTTHVTAPVHPALTALVHPCTSSLNRWILYRSWPHWCRNRRSISHGFTVFLHLTVSTGLQSHQQSEEKANKEVI
jgi:hypothetical protein